MLQSEVASNLCEGTYSGLVTMLLDLLDVSLSLDRLNSSYSESPKVITISGGSTLSTGEALLISELVLHTFAGLMASFLFSVLIQNHFALEQLFEKCLLKSMGLLVQQSPHIEIVGGDEEILVAEG